MKMINSENPDNPFSFESQLTNIYSNKVIDQFFSVLINSIGGKDFLILVIGESQSGKTTLLTKLTTQIKENLKPCHLKIREKDDPLPKNSKYPAFLYNTEDNQVIILDDAHKLNPQELSIILKNVWDSDKKTNQLILFCEPEINSMLSSLLKKMPKKTSVNKLYIPSLDQQQTKSYLNHYLKESNLIDIFTFSKTSVKNIYKKSKGLPGKINLAAEQIFLKKTASIAVNRKPKSLFSPALAFTIIILFLFSITGFVLLKKNNTISLFNSNKTASDPPLKTITKTIIPSDKTNKQEIVQPSIIEEKIKSKTFETSTITETDIQTPNTITPIQKELKKPEPIKTKSLPQKSVTIAKIQKKTSIWSTKKPVILQEKWIMFQEPLLYTIQVMAAKEEDSVSRFLKLNKNNPNEIAYYKMYSNDGTWYKFISGKYKTFEKAKSACYDLPEQLQKLGPWPRKFASIQKDIGKE